MLVILFLEDEELFVLIGLAARGPKFGREQPGALEKFFIVELRVHTAAGENHQAAPAPQVVLDGLECCVGKVRYVGENHAVKVVEARLRQLGCGDDARLDEVIRPGLRRHGHERVLEEEHFAVARLVPRLAVDEQHLYLLDGADGDGALVVGRQTIFRDARGHRVESLGAKLGEHGHALGRPGGQRVDGELVRRRFAVHTQAHAGVARLLLAEVGDLRLEAERLVHRAQAAGEAELAQAEILLLVLIDEDEVRLDFALRAFERALNFRKLPPARGLAVSDEVNLAAQGEAILERVDGLLQGRENVRGAVGERRFAQRLAGKIEIEGRLGNGALHDVAGKQHGRGAAGGHGVQRAFRRLLRLFEARARAVAHAHALRVIENDDARDLALAKDIGRVRQDGRPRQRQREQGEQQAAQGEQDHVLDAHPPLVLLDGVLQETHRGPDDLVKLPPVQQVNDDRNRHRGQTREHDGIEETHDASDAKRPKVQGPRHKVQGRPNDQGARSKERHAEAPSLLTLGLEPWALGRLLAIIWLRYCGEFCKRSNGVPWLPAKAGGLLASRSRRRWRPLG